MAPLPLAVPATFDQLIRSATSTGRLVTVYGVIRDADTVMSSGVAQHPPADCTPMAARLTPGGRDNPPMLNGLLDAEVLVTGAVSGRLDGKMQQTGIVLHVTSMDGVKVLRRAAIDPWSLPITPMDDILAGYHVTRSQPEGARAWNAHLL